MLEVVVIAQGDELTTGQTVDTNSAWIGDRLWSLGVALRRVLTAPDRLGDLVDVIGQAAGLAPVVVCSGGLGPTRDDLTAEAAAAAFGLDLVEDAPALAQIEAIYARWGRHMNPSNRKQALLPDGCRVLENRWGTAPGFAIDRPGDTTLYFLPGVPREMKAMFETWVEPEVLARLGSARPVTHTVRVIGVAESALEEKMRAVEAEGLTIGFRTNLPENQVKLRFAPGSSPEARSAVVSRVREIIGWRAFGVDCGDLAAVVGDRLAERGDTLALAESCTAGTLAAWVATVPGASRYLVEGAVVYANEAKTRTCGVPESMLAEHGAVSEPVARQLAAGIRARAGTTWGLGITGVAGPSGGTPDKPVGTVHIALAGPAVAEHQRFNMFGDRQRVVDLSAGAALAMLWKTLSS